MVRKIDGQVKANPVREEDRDVKMFLPYAEVMARGNPDLAQELLITALEAVRDGVPKSHVLHRMQYRRDYDWTCGGVQNGTTGTSADKPSRRRRPEVQSYDDAMLYVRSKDNVADVACFNVQLERLLRNLTPEERNFWTRMEMNGYYARGREAHNGWRKMVALKNQVRERVREYLEV